MTNVCRGFHWNIPPVVDFLVGCDELVTFSYTILSFALAFRLTFSYTYLRYLRTTADDVSNVLYLVFAQSTLVVSMLSMYYRQCCRQQQFFIRYTREAVFVTRLFDLRRTCCRYNWLMFLSFSFLNRQRYLKALTTPWGHSSAFRSQWMTAMMMYLFCFS